MAQSLAHTGSSAHIIAFPGTLTTPVANPKRRLRYSTVDKNVSNIRYGHTLRMWSERVAERAQKRTLAADRLNSCIAYLQFVIEDARKNLSLVELAQINGFAGAERYLAEREQINPTTQGASHV